MKKYRVFVTRHFIDVCYFDIEAPTQRKAVNAARKSANALRDREQSRKVATDNTWIPDDGIEIENIGYPKPKSYKMKQFLKTKDCIVYKESTEDKFERLDK